MLKRHIALLLAPLALTALVPDAQAQQGGASPVALTIYNQDFAVARTTVDLDLKAGLNQIATTNVTSQLEPDSVVLRDPAGKATFKITEQNYDAGVIDQNSMMQKFEGKMIQFSRGVDSQGKPITIDGKIIRASRPTSTPTSAPTPSTKLTRSSSRIRRPRPSTSWSSST
jgi:hypothetical protein